MTDEQILELATYHFYDDGGHEWAGTDEGIIEFAQRIRRDTLFEVVSILQNVPNPEANRTAINKILNHIEMGLK